MYLTPYSFFFFFNDTATTEIYTLSLHDALPISCPRGWATSFSGTRSSRGAPSAGTSRSRSEEHTSELQSQSNLVCRLLLEKKKKKYKNADVNKSSIRYSRLRQYTVHYLEV